MSRTHPAQRARRRARSAGFIAGLLVVAALTGVVGCPSLTDSFSASPTVVPSRLSSQEGPDGEAPGTHPGQPGGDSHAALDVTDGVVPDGVTVFDEDLPAVAKLDPDLLHALHEAATDAAGDGVEFDVNSGWRSAAYQEELLREAIFEHGSEEEATRWVATADTSPHVSGEAIDIGGSGATTWLSEQGAAYGLCQIYDNEPWHYELRPDAIADGCPARYPDPSYDPRMQQ